MPDQASIFRFLYTFTSSHTWGLEMDPSLLRTGRGIDVALHCNSSAHDWPPHLQLHFINTSGSHLSAARRTLFELCDTLLNSAHSKIVEASRNSRPHWLYVYPSDPNADAGSTPHEVHLRVLFSSRSPKVVHPAFKTTKHNQDDIRAPHLYHDPRQDAKPVGSIREPHS
jgi:hypothetical protein